jgi:aryl-alcohol dehydrogenase-like predicted oxidoreductase
MSKNSSDSYGEAQKGVLRMARVNCNYNRGNTSLKKKRDSMGNDIYENGKPCRYGKIPGLEEPVSRMIFGTAIGPMIEGKNADELLDAAFAKGIHTFDTARGYRRAEESLGGWMKRRDNREQVVVISKCGNCDSDGSVCVNRKVIETELAESLQALQTDYIDIYLLHRDDPKTPVSEMIDALNELQKEGKIKVFGVSNWAHERIEEANRYAKEHQLQGFSVSSPHFGLAEQIADPWGGNCVTITGKQNKAARNWYQENQMPIIAYSSLARGLMAGRIKSSQEVQAAEILDPFCVKGYVCHDNFERLARCEELAEKKGCTVSQIALAWMFRQDLNIYVLVSTTRAFRLEENLRAFTVNLSEEENRYLNAGRKAAGFMSK